MIFIKKKNLQYSYLQNLAAKFSAEKYTRNPNFVVEIQSSIELGT